MRRTLRAEPAWLVLLLGAVVLYAGSHALMALSAGLIGRALGQPADAPVGIQFSELSPWNWPLSAICNIGLLAVVVKGGAGALLAFCERTLALSVGRNARRAAVGSVLLRGTRHVASDVRGSANVAHALPLAPGKLGALLSHSIREVENGVQLGLLRGLRAGVQLIPLVLALIFVSGPVALAALLALIPFGGATAMVRRRFRAGSDAAHEMSLALHAELDEFVRHTDLWRSYGAGPRILRVLTRADARAARADARVTTLQASLSSANELLGALALIGTIVIADRLGWQLQDGRILTGAAIFFMMYRPLRDLGDARGYSLRAATALRSLAPFIAADDAGADEPPRNVAATSPVFAGAPARTLRLVDFGARDFGPATSLCCEPGEIVLVKGPTGSGKSTLLLSLLGLLPSRGELAYGGELLAARGVGSDERPFAWVPQEAPLITAPVLENVSLLGDDREQARQALRLLQLEAWAHQLGDTPIGAGGRPVSGGQRRLLSLARSFATGLPVLLLDEPLSGLDSETAAHVVAVLERLRGTRSMIVASHRFELERIADRVVAIGRQAPLAAE